VLGVETTTGSPGVRLDEATGIGRPMVGVERQRVRATEPTAENGHRPPSLWHDGRCDDRTEG
jgi:hypothetical protein